MNPSQEPGLMDNIKSGVNNIGESLKTAGTEISAKIGDLGTNVSSAADATKSGLDTLKSVLPPAPVPSNGVSFSLTDYTTMSSEFLESNSYIARAAFILLVVFMFFVILRIATGIIKYFIGRSQDPVKLVEGMIDARKSQTIRQGFGGKTIFRSNNEENGIEFTWAVSLRIEDQPTGLSDPIYSHIFSKGSLPTFDSDTTRKNIKTINQAPGLYLDNPNNKLIIHMDSFNQTSANVISVSNIPHNKWLNVIIRCKNKIIDVYINGQLVNSTVLPNVPKQNYGNVYVCHKGGFIGNLSKLLYYRHALTINEIQSSMKDSVDLNMSTPDGINSITTDYLGFKWYGI
jgi:hypothetical protein